MKNIHQMSEIFPVLLNSENDKVLYTGRLQGIVYLTYGSELSSFSMEKSFSSGSSFRSWQYQLRTRYPLLDLRARVIMSFTVQWESDLQHHYLHASCFPACFHISHCNWKVKGRLNPMQSSDYLKPSHSLHSLILRNLHLSGGST